MSCLGAEGVVIEGPGGGPGSGTAGNGGLGYAGGDVEGAFVDEASDGVGASFGAYICVIEAGSWVGLELDDETGHLVGEGIIALELHCIVAVGSSGS